MATPITLRPFGGLCVTSKRLRDQEQGDAQFQHASGIPLSVIFPIVLTASLHDAVVLLTVRFFSLIGPANAVSNEALVREGTQTDKYQQKDDGASDCCHLPDGFKQARTELNWKL
jgi:hypothetical protein